MQDAKGAKAIECSIDTCIEHSTKHTVEHSIKHMEDTTGAEARPRSDKAHVSSQRTFFYMPAQAHEGVG